MLTKSLALAAIGGLVLLGPPRIAVSTENLPDGAVAVVEAQYHTDHGKARVYGTAYSYAQGKRVERDVALRQLDDHHYRVDASWGAMPVALAVGVEQVGDDHFGPAEALIQVDRNGKAIAVAVARTNPIFGSGMPRRVNDREIEGALQALGYPVGD